MARAESSRRDVPGACPLDCPDTCQMVVTVEDGRALALRAARDHPFTRGALCGKMSGYLDATQPENRLLYPLKRVGPKGAGAFERISWEEALATIVQRFRGIADSPDGPQAILPYSYCGTMGKLQSSSLDRRFFQRLGASLLDRTICATAGALGYEYTVGQGRFGADPTGVPYSRLLINWGSNTVQTNAHLWSLMVEARKNQGATIVTIDPYRSATAARSDWHIAPRPGTDAALALGLLHVIWRENLQDQDYLDRGTIGAEQLKQRVLTDYSPRRVSAITDVPIDTIETLARRYATERPSLIRLNYGMQRHGGGGMAVRTIACLPAVVGAWRFHGGGALLSTSGAYDFNMDRLTRPDLSPPGTRTINMNQLADALQGDLPGPPIRALYVYNSNPAAVAPDSLRVRRGLSREDLFTVVHELVHTDTVDFADLVLPATSQIEHLDLHGSYGHHYVLLNEPAVAPPGECRSNNDVFRALASAFGFAPSLFPDDATLIGEALDGGPGLSGITLDRLRAEPSVRLNLPSPFLPFAEGNFPTPSGKCELFSERMRADGLDPLPTYTPPHEDPQTQPERASRFPIQLLSPPRGAFLNSTFAGHDRQRQRAGEPTIELSADDAHARGLAEGDWAEIFNDRGAFRARVALTGAVRPGVAVSQGIYWNRHSPGGVNVNATTSSALADMGGGATFFDNLVQVRPCSQSRD